MSAIFVATDYSAISDNAAEYGAHLASQWGLELKLIHAYFIPMTFNDPAIPMMPVDDLRHTSEERMAALSDKIKAGFPELKITTLVEYGDIHDTLEDAIEEAQPALVIVGSHGSDDADMWMGSTTIDMLRNAKCPVLAVPPQAGFQPVRKICLALDLSDEKNELPVEAIQQLQNTSNAAVHLLHVQKVGEEAINALDNLPAVQQLKEIGISVHLTQTAGEIDDKIASFAAEEGMQWLIVIPHHYSFWSALFHKSHTKAVVKRSQIPVLALHG